MIRICADYVYPPVPCFREGVGEAYLILPREQLLIVLDEGVVVVSHCIGWVGEQQVALPSLTDRRCEVSSNQARSAKCFRDRVEPVGVALYGVAIADRDVELAVAIDSVDPIEASAIEVYKTRCN